MENHQDRAALNVTRRIHLFATALALILGLLALVGWAFGIERLHTPLPGLPPMLPLSAAALSLTALSIWFGQRSEGTWYTRASLAYGLAVSLIGFLSFRRYLLDWDAYLHPHGVQVTALLSKLAPEGQRMPLNSSLAVCFLGFALCTLPTRSSRNALMREWLTIASAFWPFAALVGYIYGAEGLILPFAAPGAAATMAPHTALGFLAAAIALFTTDPNSGWMSNFLNTRPSGIIARKSLPAGILALLLLGGLSIAGERMGFYGRDEGVALIVSLSALTFFLLLRYSMGALSTLDTSMQETAENLRKSEEHLRMALEAAHVSTWEWDVHTNEVKVSGVIKGLFGLEPTIRQSSGDAFLESIHPDDRELVQSRAYRAIAGTELYQVEYRVLCPDQTVRWVASRGEVIRNESGQPLRMTGTSMDITERRLLEKELIETSNREQRRLGQDLHDDLGQWLTAIHLETRALAMKLESRSDPSAADAERIVRQIREALERTRMLARGMTPAVIESGGVAAALQELATSTERMFRARCDCFCTDEVVVRNPEAALQLYRIAQEAISNALRHGNATSIAITLEPKEAGRACLCVHSNGSSITMPLPRGPGLGLHIMRYRAGLIGAQLDIRPGAEGGTEVICTFSRDL